MIETDLARQQMIEVMETFSKLETQYCQNIRLFLNNLEEVRDRIERLRNTVLGHCEQLVEAHGK